MTRSVIVVGLALALTVGVGPGAYTRRKGRVEGRIRSNCPGSSGVSGRAFERSGGTCAGNARNVARPVGTIKANADPVSIRGRAEPVPETPNMLPALWEQIKANADPGPDESGA